MKSTKMKMLLLSIVMVIIGIGVGMALVGGSKIPTLSDGTEIIAELDGKNFTANDLYAKMKEQGGEDVLLSLIDEYIANKEIEDNSEAVEYAESYISNLKAQYESYGQNFDEVLSEYYESEEQFKEIIINDYTKNLVAEKFIKNTENKFITEKEVKEYWEDEITGAMTVRYILVVPEEVDADAEDYEDKVEANEAAALKEANEIIQKLKDGEDFAELAKKHSDDSSTASEGGLYSGFVETDVVSEFWDASIALEDGKYTKTPVKSSYGYFVIQRVSQDEKPSLEESKDECLDAIYEKKVSEDANLNGKAWIEIRKSYNLNIVDSEVSKSYQKTVKELNKTAEK